MSLRYYTPSDYSSGASAEQLWKHWTKEDQRSFEDELVQTSDLSLAARYAWLMRGGDLTVVSGYRNTKAKLPAFARGAILDTAWALRDVESPPSVERRSLFLLGAEAALDLRELSKAEALARAAAATPIARFSKYRDPFAGSKTSKQQLAELVSGEAYARYQRTLMLAEEAAATKRPLSGLDIEQLGDLAGCGIARIVLAHRGQPLSWLMDVTGKLRVFDGYVVRTPAFVVNPAERSSRAIVSETGCADDRATLLSPKGDRVEEFVRYGGRILWRTGYSTASGETLDEFHLTCADLAEAEEVLRFVREAAAPRLTESSWTTKSGQAVLRGYSQVPIPLAGRLANYQIAGTEACAASIMLQDKCWFSIGGRVVEQFASQAASVAAFELWEADALRAGATLRGISGWDLKRE
jgi:hypothetical protein